MQCNWHVGAAGPASDCPSADIADPIIVYQLGSTPHNLLS